MYVLVHTFELEELYFALYLCDKYEPSPRLIVNIDPVVFSCFFFGLPISFQKRQQLQLQKTAKLNKKEIL